MTGIGSERGMTAGTDTTAGKSSLHTRKQTGVTTAGTAGTAAENAAGSAAAGMAVIGTETHAAMRQISGSGTAADRVPLAAAERDAGMARTE